MSKHAEQLDIVGSMNDGVKIGRLVGQAILFLLEVVTRPAILLTRSLFRRSFGERYFTTPQAVIAIALVAVAVLVTTYAGPWKPLSSSVLDSNLSSSPSSSIYPGSRPVQSTVSATQRSLPLYIGSLWACLILAAAVEQAAVVRRRYHEKRRWHSYSPGVPRVGDFGVLMEATIGALVAAALSWYGQYPFAFLALLSVMLGWMEESVARRALWHRVLDVIDAQIEGENLQRAVEAKVGPTESEGFTVAMPARARSTVAQLFDKSTTKPGAAVEVRPEVQVPAAAR